MSITVTGLDLAGQPYIARLALTPDQFNDIPGGHYGETVRASHIIAAGLQRDHGTDVALTPTGPHVPLHDYDTNSVIAWLQVNTTISEISDDAGGELPRDLRTPREVDPDLVY
jgi:hypothetical protein